MAGRCVLGLVLVVLLAAGSAWGEPLGSAVSYQGRLADGGAAVDGVVDLRFDLFDASTGGTQIGQSVLASGVAVAGGVFQVEIDFGADAFNGDGRWIEIGVKDPGDLLYTTLEPRQKILVAPAAAVALKPWTIGEQRISYVGGSVGVGTVEPRTTLHVVNSALGDDPSVLFGGDLIVEDSDAIVSLLSNNAGAAGSGIILKEIDLFGMLENQWGLYRGTTGAGASFLMTFGGDPNYSLNPRVFEFHTDGRLTTRPRTKTKLFSAASANLFGNTQIQIGLTAFNYTLQTVDDSNGIAAFPLDLPVGSQITEIAIGVNDFTPNAMVEMVIVEHPFGTEVSTPRESVGTSMAFQGGYTLVSSTLSTPRAIQADTVYYLELRILGSLTTAAELIDARVTYTTTSMD